MSGVIVIPPSLNSSALDLLFKRLVLQNNFPKGLIPN